MVIQHNMPAINANRQFGIVSEKLSSSTEKLSSGYSINRSADNAAGLSISEKMRKQIRGLNRAAENIEDGISYAQVADGALNEVHDMLQRINELSVQAANGTNSETDRAHINSEVQQLKAEMERIFVTTSFNEKQVWKEDIIINKGVIGQVSVQSTTVNTPNSQNLVINNETFGLMPANPPRQSNVTDYHYFYNSSSSYMIHADSDGVNLTWSAYNGTTYKTKTIDWDTLRENDFQFNIGDYFENKDSNGTAITDPDKQLLDANGDAKYDFSISLGVVTGATNEQIAKAINGTTMSYHVGSSTTFEDENGTLNSAGLSVYSHSFVYAAAYADAVLAKNKGTSGYDFETPSDIFIEPVKNASGGNMTKIPNAGASLDAARNSSEHWQLAFTSAGLGNLTATSSQVSYYSKDTDAHPVPERTPSSVTSVSWEGTDAGDPANKDTYDGGRFWSPTYTYERNPQTGKYDIKRWHASTIHRTVGDGSLGDVMHTLTGDDGLLSKNITNNAATGNKGASDKGGYIYITFDVTADTPYVYGKDNAGNDLTSNIVGSFTFQLEVTSNDTERSILDKLNTAFNDNTLFDLNFNMGNKNTSYVYKSDHNASSMLKNDFLPQDSVEDINLNIHSGSETTDKIYFDYDCLRLKTLGLEDTNVLTEENALAAIDEISSALEMISAQRSLFGAYQNRMEHAYNIDKNSAENTQAAESQIRDTDMAKEMVQYSNLNILGQAGQSMLAQANQKNQGILTLLG